MAQIRCMDVRAWRAGELMIVSVTGVTTLTGMREMRDRLAAMLRREDARAIVSDLRRVVCGLTSEDWQRYAMDATGAPPSLPNAMVVQAAQEAVARAYALDVANYGHLNHVTVEMVRALSWASRRREHWPEPPGCHPRPSGQPYPPRTGQEQLSPESLLELSPAGS